ncbi:MAG: ABC transporter ATP-binding protein [Acidobacteria bacterium]|nr:ABC transporter ATP-binding protein [Acidobacteriota bacterium]
MTGAAVIEFAGVWKGFHRNSASILLRAHLKRLVSRQPPQDLFYALKNLNFQVQPGESVAVLGANGAGKSTLLSLVAGLAPPDRGFVTVNGRLAALLELGSGFHPDLTGAENVRLNASLFGVSRKRFERIFDAVVEFAEIGDFLHEPLRTYSNGMIMRLGFSVAVSVDPDILLIDEVLAVGDHAFQSKCFEKVLELRRQGKTILCVSHATGMVQQLCSRAIWLDHGELMLDGPIQQVADAYQGRLRCGPGQ